MMVPTNRGVKMEGNLFGFVDRKCISRIRESVIDLVTTTRVNELKYKNKIMMVVKNKKSAKYGLSLHLSNFLDIFLVHACLERRTGQRI